MAPFPRDVRKAMQQWLYKAALEDLDDAFANSLQGLLHREVEIENMVRDRLGLGPTDPFPEPSDDPDDPISLLYEQAGEMEQRGRRGEHLLRKTFTIALYQLWERHGCPRPRRSAEVSRDARELLVDLKHTANCAKHLPGPSARALFARRRDMFWATLSSAAGASERTLVITPDTFNDFFEAVWSTVDAIPRQTRATRR